jgi:hypothetical protein
VSGQLYSRGRSPRYPLDIRPGGPHSRSGLGGEEENSQPPPGVWPLNPDRSARSQSLYRLSYPGSSQKFWVTLSNSDTFISPCTFFIVFISLYATFHPPEPTLEAVAHLVFGISANSCSYPFKVTSGLAGSPSLLETRSHGRLDAGVAVLKFPAGKWLRR